MDRAEYLAAIQAHCYQGEVGGEALFMAYMAAETDSTRKLKWATCMQLETETKARLRPFLIRVGLDLEEERDAEELAQRRASYPARTWVEHMQWLVRVTDYYLEQFRALESAAPPEDLEIMQSMIVHESALQNFARCELAGDTDTSLEAVNALLIHPLVKRAVSS